MNDEFKLIIVIPCYRHAHTLAGNISLLKKHNLPILIVDDGNTTPQSDILKKLEDENIILIRNDKNMGKGYSVTKGFLEAYRLGYTHALQIDADGQQDIKQVSEFARYARTEPHVLICGRPKYRNVPLHRYIARFLTHFWVSVELGLPQIIDSMCGLRVYPLEHTVALLNKRSIGKRMSFDTEILVRLYWSGTDLKFYNISVEYPADGISNFSPIKDNIEISVMHTKLCIEKILNFIKVHRRTYI
jgi:glycosyltransferase involved in cell wall biosynthesis